MKPWFSMFILLASMLGAPSLEAEEGVSAPKRILPVKSPVYALVDALYLEQGFATAAATRPWAMDQARAMLDEIDMASLSSAGLRAFEEARRLLEWKPITRGRDFAFGMGLNLSPETFWHFRLDGDAGATDENYSWIHAAQKRSSFFDIPLQMACGQGLFLEIDVEAKEEFDAVGVASNHFNAILDDASPWLDINTPFKALASGGGSWWTVRFGRDALSWGNGGTGDFMLSDWDEYHDFVGFDLYGKTASFTGTYIAMEPYKPDGTALAYSAFVGHRLEFRPWRWLRFALSESSTLAGTGANSTFSDLVHDLNFLMIYHNWNIPERANSLMTAELSVNPWKYVDVHGQFAMDEVATAYETSGDGGGGPFIGAWLAGFKAEIPAGQGYLSLAGEAAQTSPWLYNRRAAPYYYDVRQYWSLVQDKFVYLAKPLGYGWGPDALIFWAKLGYAVPGDWFVSLECTWASIGETGIGAPWSPAAADVSPSGTAENRTILHLEGGVPLSDWLSFGGDAYYIDTTNRDHLEGAWSRDVEVAAHITLIL